MRECNHPTCGETCRRPKKVKKRSYLRPFSKKRQKLNVKYGTRSKVFREENRLCVIKSPDCTLYTQGVHHVCGRATKTLLMDERHWLPACNACNLYVETHSEWARENGFKKLN